jgi:hypothetical protein
VITFLLALTLAQPEVIPVPAPAFVDSGHTVDFPGGVVELHSPLAFADRDNVVVNGNNTRLMYVGPPTVAILQLARVFHGRVKDLEFVVAVPGVGSAVLLTNLPGPSPSGRVSSGNRIENVRVLHGGYPTACRRAFSVDSFAAGGADANNDMHVFVDCYAQSFTEAGYYATGTQAHRLLYERCHAHDAGGRAVDGWKFGRGTYFAARDCGATATQCDFRLGTNETSVRVENFNSELSKRFLVSGTTNSEFPCVVDQVRWDGLPSPGVPVIDSRGPGPWTVRNATFAGIDGVPPTMRFTGGSPTGDVDLSGVYLRQHGGPEPAVKVSVPAGWNVWSHGVWWQRIRADGSRERKPITVGTN